MPRPQKKTRTSPAKAHTVLKGEAREVYEKSRASSIKRHKPLIETIRASQLLSKEDFKLRINTRD
jgi:hypothetical protein